MGHLIVRTQKACLSIRGDGTVRVVFVEEYDAEEFVRLSIVRIQADCSFIFCKCAVKSSFSKRSVPREKPHVHYSRFKSIFRREGVIDGSGDSL